MRVSEYCETQCQHQHCEACARPSGGLRKLAPGRSRVRQGGYDWVTRKMENEYFDALEHHRNIKKNRR